MTRTPVFIAVAIASSALVSHASAQTLGVQLAGVSPVGASVDIVTSTESVAVDDHAFVALRVYNLLPVWSSTRRSAIDQVAVGVTTDIYPRLAWAGPDGVDQGFGLDLGLTVRVRTHVPLIRYVSAGAGATFAWVDTFGAVSRGVDADNDLKVPVGFQAGAGLSLAPPLTFGVAQSIVSAHITFYEVPTYEAAGDSRRVKGARILFLLGGELDLSPSSGRDG